MYKYYNIVLQLSQYIDKTPLAHQKSLSTETLFVQHFRRRRIIRA